jgi:hypothetical protein
MNRLFPNLPEYWEAQGMEVLRPDISEDELTQSIWKFFVKMPIRVEVIDAAECVARVKESAGTYAILISASIYTRLRALFLLFCKTKFLCSDACAIECLNRGFRFLELDEIQRHIATIFSKYETNAELCQAVDGIFRDISYREPLGTSATLTELAIQFLLGHEIGHVNQKHFKALYDKTEDQLKVALDSTSPAGGKMYEVDADAHGAEYLGIFAMVPYMRLRLSRRAIPNEDWDTLLATSMRHDTIACCAAIEMLHYMNVKYWPGIYSQVSERMYLVSSQISLVYFRILRHFLGMDYEDLLSRETAKGLMLFRQLVAGGKDKGGYETETLILSKLDGIIERTLETNECLTRLRRRFRTCSEEDLINAQV